MKKLAFLLVVLGITKIGAAQKYGATAEDSVECITSLSLYKEYFKQKNYKEAEPGWRKAVEICPKSRKSLYLDGVKMFRAKAKAEKDPAKKEEYIDELMKVYDLRIEHFGQKGYVLGRKAADFFKFRQNRASEAHAMFKESMELQQEKTEANVLTMYYQSIYKMYLKKEIDKSVLLEEYLPISDMIERCRKTVEKSNHKKKEQMADNYRKAKNNVDELFIKVGACDDIVAVFEKKNKANPNDIDLKKKTLRILDKRDCQDNNLYKEVAKAVHANEPSAVSAYSIGISELKAKRKSSALKYFKQAIDLCNGCDDITNYYLAAAQVSEGQSCKSYAKKALSEDPKNGKAYLLIAQAVAGSHENCGANAFEKKAVFWLAYDYAQKAKSVDPGTAGTAKQLMSAYKKQFPPKELIFDHGYLDKPSITIGCWVNESTKVRVP